MGFISCAKTGRGGGGSGRETRVGTEKGEEQIMS